MTRVRFYMPKRASRRAAKLIAIRYWNKMRRIYPRHFNEVRERDAPYKPHR